MGLLDGKKALVFGVANDHSIAWGIAKALHEQGATVGFSSIAELAERRVKPLAASTREASIAYLSERKRVSYPTTIFFGSGGVASSEAPE